MLMSGFDVNVGRLGLDRGLFAGVGFLVLHSGRFGVFVVGLGVRRFRDLMSRNGMRNSGNRHESNPILL